MSYWKRHRNWLSIMARYLIGAIIITWLLNTDLINLSSLDLISIQLAISASFFVIIQVFLAGLRVQILLKKNKISVGIGSCIVYNSVGIFYSLFLPGGMSGDLARAYCFTRARPKAIRSALFGALFVDRLLGTVVMFIAGLVAGTFYATTFNLRDFVIASWLGLAFFSLGYFFVIHQNHKVDKTRGGLMGRLGRFIEKIDLQDYGLDIIGICSLLSLIGHLCAVLVIYQCSDLMQSGLDFLQIVAVVPVGLLANALPISPGGLGVGEKIFDVMYRIMGGSQGANSFLMARLFLFAPAILGGIVTSYLFIKSHNSIVTNKTLK